MAVVEQLESVIDSLELKRLKTIRIYNNLRMQIDELKSGIKSYELDNDRVREQRIELKTSTDVLKRKITETKTMITNFQRMFNVLDNNYRQIDKNFGETKKQMDNFESESEFLRDRMLEEVKTMTTQCEQSADIKRLKEMENEISNMNYDIEMHISKRLAYNRTVLALCDDLNKEVLNVIYAYASFNDLKSDLRKQLSLVQSAKSKKAKLLSMRRRYLEKYEAFVSNNPKNASALSVCNNGHKTAVSGTKEQAKNEFEANCSSNAFLYANSSRRTTAVTAQKPLTQKRSTLRDLVCGSQNFNDVRSAFDCTKNLNFKPQKKVADKQMIGNMDTQNKKKKEENCNLASSFKGIINKGGAYRRGENFMLQSELKFSKLMSANMQIESDRQSFMSSDNFMDPEIGNDNTCAKTGPNEFHCSPPKLSNIGRTTSEASSSMPMCFSTFNEADTDTGLSFFGADDAGDDQQFTFNFKM